MNVLDTPTPAVIGRTTQRDTTVGIIGTMYLAYATSMVLRMIPTVAGTSIRADESLGINLEQWGKVLAAGTCGAMLGKFICGWAADRFGGKRTFAVALIVASAFVGLFAMSSTLLMTTRRTPSRPHDTATSLSHTDTKLTARARPTAGHIAAIGEIPAALRAVISLVADILPNTLATAKSIVPGTANRIASGSGETMSM